MEINKKPVHILIPARYHSVRFEGKPLTDILGKSMIEHVYERACMVTSVSDVTILTEDIRILNEVKEFGGNCILTSDKHETGTDRILEAIEKLDLSGLIINLQGDEPLIDPRLIEAIIHEFQYPGTEIVSACNRITNTDDLFDYNIVKVVRTLDHHAMYFSRNAIPAFKNRPYKEWLFHSSYFRHIGIYAFTSEILLKIATLDKSKLENVESLEQLRWLEAGLKIKCIETDYESVSVDVPEDVDKVVQILVSEQMKDFI